jgi:16S rRNA (guanine1207-N2)-methyltransferase
MDSALQTLFLPLENGDVSMAGRTLFLYAQAHPALSKTVNVWQPFKPRARDADYKDMPPGPYDLVLILIPKQVDEAKYALALALERLAPNGILLAAAANDANGARLEGWFEEAGLAPQSMSKNKARAVWAQRSANVKIPQGWIENGASRVADIGDGLLFHTQPGLFSWDRVDPASRLFAAHFPPALSGRVADFGCGTGYLSYRALEHFPKISELTLIEADARALSCASQNLEKIRNGKPVLPLWHDATQALPDAPAFDHILMNPPFHAGKKTDIDVARGFITTAHAHLKKNGALSLVANVHLPYESVLQELFKSFKQVAVENGFKILRAIK